MFTTLYLVLLAVIYFVLAQETGPNNATVPSIVDGEITIHFVTVGKTTNEFVPNSIVANPGDIVQFQFYPQNHSVIQSLYGWPCIPKIDVVPEEPYFFSGFFPVDSPDGKVVSPVISPRETGRTRLMGKQPTWNLTINDTSPVFFYCGAPGSCVSWGMLGVINADSHTDLVTQLSLARSEAYMLEPGAPLSADASSSLAAIAASITAFSSVFSPTVTVSSVTTAAVSPTLTPQSSPLSSGAIAGIAIGGIVVLAILGALIYILGRNKSLRRALDQQRPSTKPPNVRADPLSPPPMYQPFSRFAPEDENKDDIIHTHTSPLVSTYSPYASHYERDLQIRFSRSRFSGTSELSADAPHVLHELYAPLASTLQDGSRPHHPAHDMRM